MKAYPLSFRRDKIDCVQVKRIGRVAIYELSKPHWSRKSYEVVLLGCQKARTVTYPGGRVVERPAQETCPPTEKWGQSGWSYMDIDSAEDKFRQLLKKQK